MSSLRFTRHGFAASTALSLVFAASLAHAQEPAPVEAAPAAAPDIAGTPEPAPAPALPEAAPAPAVPAATVSADPAADAAADAAAASAAAEALSSIGAETTDEFKLNLYGFADFTYSTQLKKFDLAPEWASFAVGKLNLYAGADLGDNWRSLAEVRFMYLPHGTTAISTTGESPPRTDTTVPDMTDLAKPTRWGGISIQRAWLEHTFHPAFTVRVGSWLTPYGIWNVDHGSPVIIGVRRPFIINEGLFPESQTGVEMYGALNFGPSQVGYHLTVSNGRGPIDTFQDLDRNKGVGARVFFKHDASFGNVTIGASGYKGRYTDRKDQFGIDPASGKFISLHPVTQRYDELSLALDAKWEWKGLLVQSEAILNDVAYDDRYRPQVPFAADGGPLGFNPDHRRIGLYGLAGYRTPFLGIMPFFGGEYYDQGLYTFTPRSAAVWGGLNVRPTARVVLKAQYTHSWFTAPKALPDPGGFNGIDLQAAWSF